MNRSVLGLVSVVMLIALYLVFQFAQKGEETHDLDTNAQHAEQKAAHNISSQGQTIQDPLLPPISYISPTPVTTLPDFSQYQDVKQKKQAFFDFIYPIIQQENAHILRLRHQLQTLQQQAALSQPEQQWLNGLKQHYKIAQELPTPALIEALLLKVDLIPPSLAMTQAAIESGWGSSRFARQGNNLFGQWCFKKGCGMVPSARDDGRGHEVAKFASVNAAIRAYLLNLNSFSTYQSLRKIRAEQRSQGDAPNGLAMAEGLLRYSEEREKYVEKVQGFIRYNKLNRYQQAR